MARSITAEALQESPPPQFCKVLKQYTINQKIRHNESSGSALELITLNLQKGDVVPCEIINSVDGRIQSRMVLPVKIIMDKRGGVETGHLNVHPKETEVEVSPLAPNFQKGTDKKIAEIEYILDIRDGGDNQKGNLQYRYSLSTQTKISSSESNSQKPSCPSCTNDDVTRLWKSINKLKKDATYLGPYPIHPESIDAAELSISDAAPLCRLYRTELSNGRRKIATIESKKGQMALKAELKDEARKLRVEINNSRNVRFCDRNVTQDQWRAIRAMANTLYGEAKSCAKYGPEHYMAIARIILNRAEFSVANETGRQIFIKDYHCDPNFNATINELEQPSAKLNAIIPYIVWSRRDKSTPEEHSLTCAQTEKGSPRDGDYFQFNCWDSNDPNVDEATCPTMGSEYVSAMSVALEAVLDRETFDRKTKTLKELYYRHAGRIRGTKDLTPKQNERIVLGNKLWKDVKGHKDCHKMIFSRDASLAEKYKWTYK